MSAGFSLDPEQVTRRSFLELAARQWLGVTVAGSSLATGTAGAATPSQETPLLIPAGKAKHVIYLRMRGAMTHIDTFDPKPGRPELGETKAIATHTPGLQIGEHLPQLAKLSDDLALVRSVTTSTADHGAATYLLQTSYRQIATIRHPSIGAFANRMLGLRKKSLPDHVAIGLGERTAGAGYLDPAFSPVPVGDPSKGLHNTKAPEYLQGEQLNRRMDLVNKFSQDFRRKYDQKQVAAYGEYYKQAIELMGSKDLKVFDLDQEKDSVRDRYGRSQFGQGVLLARRLVQEDTRWIDISFGSWDMHNDIYSDNQLPGRAATLDKTMSALLEDLTSTGLIKTTLVVLATEFGRKPRINDRGGRDHHPGVFSLALAGAGVKGGAVYGKSDKDGHGPEDDSVSVADFNATIAAAMGLPYQREIHAKNGRPFRIANEGKPIDKLLT